VRAAEVVEQLLVRRGLLQRVQLRTVQVLQQGVAEHDVVAGLPHDRRDHVEAGLGDRPPAALPHDQLVAVLAVLAAGAPDHHGLEQPDLAHRVHQLGHRVLVEDLARLAGVGADRPHRQLGEVGPLDRGEPERRVDGRRGPLVQAVLGIRLVGGDQGPEAASQSTSLLGSSFAHAHVPLTASSRAASR
jgi:hypothetical protein